MAAHPPRPAAARRGPHQREPLSRLLRPADRRRGPPLRPRRAAEAGDTAIAVESKQTQAVRRLAEHSQHRLFLSATPHNGYSWSWQALLEMLDPQRFFKGREPDKATLDQVMIRRLKTDIRNADGTPRFPAGTIHAIDVIYTDAERKAYELLQHYTAARRGRRRARRRAGPATW